MSSFIGYLGNTFAIDEHNLKYNAFIEYLVLGSKCNSESFWIDLESLTEITGGGDVLKYFPPFCSSFIRMSQANKVETFIGRCMKEMFVHSS